MRRLHIEPLEHRLLLASDAWVMNSASQTYGVDFTGHERELEKLGGDLAALWIMESSDIHGTRLHSDPAVMEVVDGEVAISAVAESDVTALSRDLHALGLHDSITRDLRVDGWLPISSLNEVALLDELVFAHRAVGADHDGQGDVVSQGDISMRAAQARSRFGVTGDGISVGAMSDSFNLRGEADDDYLSDDLPQAGTPSQCDDDDTAVVTCVINEGPPGSSDEGRALMQIVHDIAPDARLLFTHDGPANVLGLPGATSALLNRGADVVVDDYSYSLEPIFQDGFADDAVNLAYDDNEGVPYFTSAGNSGELGYQSSFRVTTGAPQGCNGTLHDFDEFGGGDYFQSITVPIGSEFRITMQWDEPFKTLAAR